MIFLDSNIVIDLIESDGTWTEWSRAALKRTAGEKLATSTVVIAETAANFAGLEDQMDYFCMLEVAVHDLDAASARRAGRAHRAYRRAGGTRIGILADFLIGGHAATLNATLMTRDRKRFADYFPELALITPETHPHC